MNGKNCHHSPRATLAAVGLKLQALQSLAPIREKVKIAQKKIKHEPQHSLLWICLIGGLLLQGSRIFVHIGDGRISLRAGRHSRSISTAIQSPKSPPRFRRLRILPRGFGSRLTSGMKRHVPPSRSRPRHSHGSYGRRRGSSPPAHALPVVAGREGQSLHDPWHWRLKARA